MQIESLSVAQLKKALALREQIDELQQRLASIMGGRAEAEVLRSSAPAPVAAAANHGAYAAPAPVKRRKKRQMSEEGRRRISEATKARWARERARKAAGR